MKLKKAFTQFLPALGIVILILDTKTALAGTSEGLSLCFQTLIPSLMPFIFLSILLTNSLLGKANPILSHLAGICHMESGTESLLLIGLLGGYPVGAQSIGTAYTAGQIEKKQAERMLAFCNNAGPAFLFGVIGCAFSDPIYPWLLWGVHVVSALLVAMIFPRGEYARASISSAPISVISAMQLTIKAMATVCGWVILFRTLLSILNRWVLWVFPVPVQVLIAGIFELANGCVQLSLIPSENARFVVASAMLSLGGLCVAMQTISVTSGLSCKNYFCGKAVQTVFSVLLSGIICKLMMTEYSYRIPVHADLAVLAALLFLLVMLWKKKNRSSIPTCFRV